MQKLDLIIFDVDGTITSTNELIFASFNHVMKKYRNNELTPAEIIELFGPTEENLLKDMFKENSSEVIEEYFTFYRENHNMAALYDGIKDILDFIKVKGIPLGVFTGKGRRSSTITLEELGVKNYFDMIVSGDDVDNHKPHPEGVVKLVSHFRSNPEKTILIGDAISDIHAARGAGIKIGAAVWDSYAREKVLQLGGDYVFHSVEELDKFFKNILS